MTSSLPSKLTIRSVYLFRKILSITKTFCKYTLFFQYTENFLHEKMFVLYALMPLIFTSLPSVVSSQLFGIIRKQELHKPFSNLFVWEV